MHCGSLFRFTGLNHFILLFDMPLGSVFIGGSKHVHQLPDWPVPTEHWRIKLHCVLVGVFFIGWFFFLLRVQFGNVCVRKLVHRMRSRKLC